MFTKNQTTMKNCSLFLSMICVLGIAKTHAQQFDIILGMGFYATPSLKPVEPAYYFNGEFEYHLPNNKWALSAGIIRAKYTYRLEGSRRTLGGIPINQGSELQSNFLLKYKFFSKNWLTVQAGAGVGLVTMGRVEEILNDRSVSYLYEVSNTDVGFPLAVEAYTNLTKHFIAGVKLGSFIFPDYPIIGYNVSLQLRYRF